MGSVDEAIASGSRIRAVFGVTDDGSSDRVGWYDSEIDAMCEFGKSADGTLRCIPQGEAPYLFADSTCTTPVSVPDDCDETKVQQLVTLVRNVPVACGTIEIVDSRTFAYEVTDQAHTGSVYMRSGISCNQAATSFNGAQVMTEISSARLVERTLVISAD